MMLKANLSELEETGEIGDWSFDADDRHFCFLFYDEIEHKKDLAIIPISLIPLDQKGVYWMWNGNREAPTFIPSPQSSLVSVRILGPTDDGPDRFHKSMVDGKWV